MAISHPQNIVAGAKWHFFAHVDEMLDHVPLLAAVDAEKLKAKGRKRKLPAAEVEEDADEAGEDAGSEFEAPKRKTRKGRGGAKSARGRRK